jgi:hypothetical protein
MFLVFYMVPLQSDREVKLHELELYLGQSMTLLRNPLDRLKVEGILERTVSAIHAGATPEDIARIYSPHVSAYDTDSLEG